jgi:RNA polymerase sigma-70 factor (ECF subfamily)
VLDAHGDVSDAECVVRARAGVESARVMLVQRHHAGCLRFARHLLGDDGDAEDAVQETFIRAFSALHRYEERDTFRGWLFGILLNRCRTAAVRRAHRRAHVTHDFAAAREVPVDGDERLVDAQRALARALEGLDVEHREAFLLKVGEEMDYDEMARLTGASVPALKMRVKRARDHVRAHWTAVPRG